MLGKRVTFESVFAKQHGFPEGIHPWKMNLPVHSGHIVKDWTENLVCLHTFIERIHHQDNIIIGSNVFTVRHNHTLLTALRGSELSMTTRCIQRGLLTRS